MERLHAKLIAMFGMFFVIFICMCLPVKVSKLIERKGSKAKRILGLLRCFAGGVFLGTIMLHMIPETHDLIQEFILEPNGWTYPFAELSVVFGFFFICLFERVVLTIDSKRRAGKKKNYLATNEVMKSTHEQQKNGTPCALNKVIDETGAYVNNGYTKEQEAAQQVNGASALPEKVEIGAAQSEEEQTKTRSIILILALSFECIFDGISVSMQITTKGVWDMFLAILSHEFIIAFCLGVELTKYYPTKKVILSAFAYAMMPPAGCVIGLIITEADSNADLHTAEICSGLLIAMAAGIFLYCTFIGMLGEELINDCTFEKILATFIGCAIMCGAAAIPEPGADEDLLIEATTEAAIAVTVP